MNRKYLMAALINGAFVLSSACFAQDTASVTKTANKAWIANENAKQLLLIMDTDKNGKISKQEWLNFMSAEFDRLDTDHSGELDPHELLSSRVTVHHVRTADQGK
jgi:Ca2+-binding EF-hand superfamily protein